MVGRTISHYQILEKLGEGGMGVVYKARDTQLERLVALKFLHSSEDVPRLLREAKVGASLNHLNICTVHEVNPEHGFIAMELVEGPSLATKIGGRPLPVGEAVGLAVQLCEGVKAAHDKGIIHRDIKSGNVLVTADGQAKILDFGLARLAGQASLTREGTAAGTPGYMAPEQMRGEAVDQRTDIWAVGAVLHEMLTGRLPMGQAETLPEGLGRVVRKALAADSGERYQHIDDMLVDLRKWQAPSARRSRRWLIAGATAAAAAGAAGVWVWRGQPQRRAPLTSLVVLPFENVGGSPDMEYLSDGITESLINSLSQVRQLRVMARATAFRFKGSHSQPQAVGRELKVMTVLTGRVLQKGSRLTVQVDLVDVGQGTQLWGQRYDRKLDDILAIQDDVAREIADNLSLELTASERAHLLMRYTENTEAYQLYLRGRSYWNLRYGDSLKKGVGFFEQATRLDPAYALAWSGLADCYNVMAEYLSLRPRDTFPKAFSAARRAVAADDSLAEAHTSLAQPLGHYEWDYASAEREFRRAKQLNPHYPTAYHWHALLLIQMGQPEAALREVERAIEFDPLAPAPVAAKLRCLLAARRYDETIRVAEQAIRIHPQYEGYRSRLGLAYCYTGQYELARRELAAYASESVLGSRRFFPLAVLNALQGRKSEARQLVNQFVRAYREDYFPPICIAFIYGALGENDRAFEWLDRALEERDIFLGLVHDQLADPLRADPRFRGILRRANLPEK